VEDRRGAYRDFVVGSEEKRSLGRRENIKKDLQKLECGGMD
jgi:hypothetical protein